MNPAGVTQPPPVSLAALAALIDAEAGGCALAGRDLPVAALAIDSRRVTPGALFAALPGAAADGRAFIPQALAAGAVALLLPAGAAPPPDVPALLCAAPRRAAGRVAQRLAGDPAARLALLGVTGTNGKSSCVLLLQALMGGAPRWGALGTLRFDTGGAVHPSTHTTPDPVSLAALLGESVDRGQAGVAMEVSSHALDQERVAGLAFAGVLFTNLSRDHLDYHGDMARYLDAKRRLLGLRRPGATALVNADDPAFAPWANGRDVLGVGRAPGAAYRVRDVELGAAGSRFRLDWQGGSLAVTSPLTGDFNVSNAAGALALALALGEAPAALAARLAAFDGVPGRMQRVPLAEGPLAIVDYAHSPDAVERVLAACRPLCAGRLVVVLGAGGDRDRGKRPLMARAAQAGADVVVLTSDNPRSEDPAAILAEMETGLDRSRGSWHKEVDRARAIRLALDGAAPGDLVAVLGKGHERTQEIAGERLPFDDVDVLRRAWAALNGER